MNIQIEAFSNSLLLAKSELNRAWDSSSLDNPYTIRVEFMQDNISVAVYQGNEEKTALTIEANENGQLRMILHDESRYLDDVKDIESEYPPQWFEQEPQIINLVGYLEK